jgi:hypothetical protein
MNPSAGQMKRMETAEIYFLGEYVVHVDGVVLYV